MNTVIAVGQVNISGLMSGEMFPRCEVVRAHYITEISAQQSVVVAGEGAQLPEGLSALAVIVDADSDIDLSALHGNAVITCGISGRNTVSVTSKTSDSITLSLNRAIHTLCGLCEPMELPMPLCEGCSDFEHMAAFAATVVFGDFFKKSSFTP